MYGHLRARDAVPLLDRCGMGYHRQADVPENIMLIFLPSRALVAEPSREHLADLCSEPALEDCLRELRRHHRVAACDARRKLTAQPETITSIGMRDWAHVGQSL